MRRGWSKSRARVGAVLVAVALTVTGCRSGTVTYVVDGDTADVDGQRVRFIGIDTPERGQCGYIEAKNRVKALVLGQRVTVMESPGNTSDRYGRELGYLQFGRVDVGRQLIAEGLAHARYDSRDGYPEHPREDDYRSLDARTRNLCE
ncbi:MAG: thermonuclease family protein [Actinomycetes bacterium]